MKLQLICPGHKRILTVIYVKTPQKSCVDCFKKILSARNVFPVFVLVGNVLRFVSNHQLVGILQSGEFGYLNPLNPHLKVQP